MVIIDQDNLLKTSYGDRFNPYGDSGQQKQPEPQTDTSRCRRDSFSKAAKSPAERELMPTSDFGRRGQLPSPNPYFEMESAPAVQSFGSALAHSAINPPGSHAGLFAMVPPPKDDHLPPGFLDLASDDYRAEAEEDSEERKKESFFRMNKKDKPTRIVSPGNENLGPASPQNPLERMDSEGKLLTAANSPSAPAKEHPQKPVFAGLSLSKASSASEDPTQGASERLMAL